jgi:hypothetical protein
MSASEASDAREGLECTAAAKAFQKAFGAELRERVVERGEPFAVAQADTPHEIFHAMDIPVVSNQWWSAYISAKRLSSRYFAVLDDLGFPPNRCSYCSLVVMGIVIAALLLSLYMPLFQLSSLT